MDVIERHALATDEALRRRAEELAGHRRILDDRIRRLATELAGARVRADRELTDGLRRLRDDARPHLEHGRSRYPELLTAGVTELGRRYLARGRELVAAAAARVLAGLDVEPPELREPVAVASSISPPPRRGRWSAEDGVIVLAGVSGGMGLARLLWVAGPVGAGLAMSAGLMVTWWLVRARRTSVERAGLERWGAELLGDTEASLRAELTERLLEFQRRARTELDELNHRLQEQAAAHERCVQRVLARRREVG